MAISLPPVVKTWQQAETSIAGYGSGNTSQNIADALRAVKDMFLAFALGGPASGPPSLRGSVNNAGTGGMDAVDRWTSQAAVGITQATYYPWVCIEFADGSELLIVGRTSSTSSGITGSVYYYSQADGFVFTVNTARPTATDEKLIQTGNTNTGISTTAATHVHLVQLSTDGTQFRIFMHTAGTCTFLAGVCNAAVKKSWVGPIVYGTGPASPVGGVDLSITTLADSGRALVAGVWVNAKMTGPSTLSGTVLRTLQTVVNTRDSAWPIWPTHLTGDTAGDIGPIGVLLDSWHTSGAIPNGSGMPKAADSLGAEDQFFATCTGLVFPNPSGVPITVS